MIDYRARFLLQFLYTEYLIRDDVDISVAIKKYDEGEVLQLQDLIGQYIKNEHTWMTSIGLIDAMDIVYKDAIRNGNINRSDDNNE